MKPKSKSNFSAWARAGGRLSGAGDGCFVEGLTVTPAKEKEKAAFVSVAAMKPRPERANRLPLASPAPRAAWRRRHR